MLSAMVRQIRARKDGVTIRLSGDEGYKAWKNEQMGRTFFDISDKQLDKIAERIVRWMNKNNEPEKTKKYT